MPFFLLVHFGPAHFSWKILINWLSHIHFSLNYFVAAKRPVILKGVTATGEGHLHVSMFACSHPLFAVMILDSMEILRVTLIWLFVLEGIRKKQSSQSIFAVILSHRYDTRSIGISRRIILACHTKPDPILHRISSPVHSATTNVEPKTMKSPLCSPAHGEPSPCSWFFRPLPPLPCRTATSARMVFDSQQCSAPLKAITRGMLVMQTCLNLSTS